MPTLTRTDIARKLAAQLKIPRATAYRALDFIVTEITGAVSAGLRVEFRNFGVWETRIGKSRTGRNPSDPNSEAIIIPARPVIRFRVGKNLKAALAKFNQGTLAGDK